MAVTNPDQFVFNTIPKPFQQVNIDPNDSNTASYDNAEILDMSTKIYTFAQQKASKLLPHLTDVGKMKGQFFTKDRFGKFEFSVRTKGAGPTPHSKHTNDTRAATSIKLHAGHIMDMDDIGDTRYAIQPQVQMELAKSLGRSIDRVIYSCLDSPVVEYSSVAEAAFNRSPNTCLLYTSPSPRD